jgi:hypothetical protein
VRDESVQRQVAEAAPVQAVRHLLHQRLIPQSDCGVSGSSSLDPHSCSRDWPCCG